MLYVWVNSGLLPKPGTSHQLEWEYGGSHLYMHLRQREGGRGVVFGFYFTPNPEPVPAVLAHWLRYPLPVVQVTATYEDWRAFVLDVARECGVHEYGGGDGI